MRVCGVYSVVCSRVLRMCESASHACLIHRLHYKHTHTHTHTHTHKHYTELGGSTAASSEFVPDFVLDFATEFVAEFVGGISRGDSFRRLCSGKIHRRCAPVRGDGGLPARDCGVRKRGAPVTEFAGPARDCGVRRRGAPGESRR